MIDTYINPHLGAESEKAATRAMLISRKVDLMKTYGEPAMQRQKLCDEILDTFRDPAKWPSTSSKGQRNELND